MSEAPERKTATIYTDLIGEGIHIGLRKASEHPASGYAWRAIADLPNDEWQAIVEYAVAGSTVDIPATDEQALANPKVQALVDADKLLDEMTYHHLPLSLQTEVDDEGMFPFWVVVDNSTNTVLGSGETSLDALRAALIKEPNP